MEDIGITPVQFEEACNQGNREEMPVHFDQVSFIRKKKKNEFIITSSLPSC